MIELQALIVDDNSVRTRRIISILEDAGFNLKAVATSTSIASATKRLLDQRFDLLIVDLALPQLEGESPLPDGGQILIKQLEQLKPQIISPSWIIGITAYEDSRKLAAMEFDQRLVSILNTTNESTAWESQLSLFVKRIFESATTDSSPRADVCFLSALQSPELDAIEKLPVDWSLRSISPFFASQHSGEITLSAKRLTVEAFTFDKMGLVPMAYLSAAVATTYRPRLMILTGICGGVSEAVELGDIVIAESSWNWQAGKLKEDGLKIDSDSIQASPSLVAIAKHVSASMNMRLNLMTLGENIHSQKNRLPTLHVGPMASGSAVVADSTVRKAIVDQNRKVLALDMEAHAFYGASRFTRIGSTQLICIKSACDRADSLKADDLQSMCAMRSALVALEIVKGHFAGVGEDAIAGEYRS